MKIVIYFLKSSRMTYAFIKRKGQYLFVVFFILVGLVYFFGVYVEIFQKSNISYLGSSDTNSFPGYLVYTPGCRIPEMNPFDKSLLKYLKSAPTIQCSNKPPLIQSDLSSLWINKPALRYYNVSNMSDLYCCYTKFGRDDVNQDHISINIDNSIIMDKKCQFFNQSAIVEDEFVQVTCSSNNTTIYTDYHAFVVPKKKNLSLTHFNNEENLSILIIGADALSRLNFYRQMTKTKEFLKSLEAIEFFGYNKVHDNTFPNLVPLLSGYSVSEIREKCWYNDSIFFDECPWIWKNFSSKNFYTAFGEDSYNIGLFNYLKKGFLQSPTDYYLRPYMEANEKWIGHSKFLNTKYCVGTRFAAEVLFDYAYKFCVNMTSSDSKFWGFFWETSLTHDFLNVPANNDNIFFNFFKSIVEKNVLNKTVVFFLSDHGMRWGSIRETYQGRMEEHLPFLYIILPTWFKKKYLTAINNLKKNTNLLTTHYDVHETLKDLTDLNSLKNENIEARMLKQRNSRGVSLFMPISLNRTCENAGILPTWCTCQQNRIISKTEKEVVRAAKLTVTYLNSLLSEHKQCSQLKLKNIISARKEDEEKMMKTEVKNSFSDYILIIETEPGLAKFEATVRHRTATNEFIVLGDISRINIYGSQSKCITDYRLKLYCYCI